MASNSLFSQLLLVALVLICLFTYVALPDDSPCAPKTPPESNKRRRKRSTEPKPFPGFIHKPLCAAWEQEADGASKAPGSPPPIIRFTQGRRRSVDPRSHCCPTPDCPSRGWPGLGVVLQMWPLTFL
jgi:hypothetical protein